MRKNLANIIRNYVSLPAQLHKGRLNAMIR